MMPSYPEPANPDSVNLATLRRPPRPRHRLAELELRAFLEDALPLCIGPIPCPATYWVLGKFPSIFCPIPAFTWVSLRGTQEVERALDAAETRTGRGSAEACPPEQGSDRRPLTCPELDDQMTARSEHPHGIGRDVPIRLKSIRATVERNGGIVIAHFRLKARQVRTCHVGRIGNQEVEGRPQRAGKIAGHECGAGR